MGLEKLEFHINAWLTDKALQKCSLEAHGLWINIICLMGKSPEKGKLLHRNKNIITESEIPQLINKPKEIVETILQELITNKVLKIDDNGVFYSKKLLEINDKKKQPKQPYYTDSMDYYFEWYEKRFKIKPRILATDGKALKLILNHLSTLENEKYTTLALFKIILDNWDVLDVYLIRGINLSQINQNINQILKCFKNGREKLTSTTKYKSASDANKDELTDMAKQSERNLQGTQN